MPYFIYLYKSQHSDGFIFKCSRYRHPDKTWTSRYAVTKAYSEMASEPTFDNCPGTLFVQLTGAVFFFHLCLCASALHFEKSSLLSSAWQCICIVCILKTVFCFHLHASVHLLCILKTVFRCHLCFCVLSSSYSLPITNYHLLFFSQSNLLLRYLPHQHG